MSLEDEARKHLKNLENLAAQHVPQPQPQYAEPADELVRSMDDADWALTQEFIDLCKRYGVSPVPLYDNADYYREPTKKERKERGTAKIRVNEMVYMGDAWIVRRPYSSRQDHVEDGIAVTANGAVCYFHDSHDPVRTGIQVVDYIEVPAGGQIPAPPLNNNPACHWQTMLVTMSSQIIAKSESK